MIRQRRRLGRQWSSCRRRCRPGGGRVVLAAASPALPASHSYRSGLASSKIQVACINYCKFIPGQAVRQPDHPPSTVPAGGGTPPCAPASGRGCRPRCSSARCRNRRTCAGPGCWCSPLLRRLGWVRGRRMHDLRWDIPAQEHKEGGLQTTLQGHSTFAHSHTLQWDGWCETVLSPSEPAAPAATHLYPEAWTGRTRGDSPGSGCVPGPGPVSPEAPSGLSVASCARDLPCSSPGVCAAAAVASGLPDVIMLSAKLAVAAGAVCRGWLCTTLARAGTPPAATMACRTPW